MLLLLLLLLLMLLMLVEGVGTEGEVDSLRTVGRITWRAAGARRSGRLAVGNF
jgi:hypothetical protein